MGLTGNTSDCLEHGVDLLSPPCVPAGHPPGLVFKLGTWWMSCDIESNEVPVLPGAGVDRICV